jgi:hypothetical protein
MDYYAAWPVWKMPKWIAISLGTIFSVIAGGSVYLIVDLTRPPAARPIALVPVVTAAPAAEPAHVAPAVPAARPEQAARVEAPTPAAATAPVQKKIARHATRDAAPSHKHAILAKRDTKSSRQAKDPIDKLLGL